MRVTRGPGLTACLLLALTGRAAASVRPSARARLGRRRPMIALQGGRELAGTFTVSQLDEDLCLLPPEETPLPSLSNRVGFFDALLFAGPFFVPAIAFFTWEQTARIARHLLDIAAARTWFSVDGGAYEIQILVPTTNGIVVPSVAIALGTLTATTIGALRQRQVELRSRINIEACELSVLRSLLVDGGGSRLSVPKRARLISYLSAYVARCIGESITGVKIGRIERAGVADNELNALLTILHREEAETGATRWLGAAEGLIVSLNGHRSQRLAILASTFPPLHYVVLTLCAVSILGVFLIESDQEVLRFLDSIQIRILWTMLTGTFASIAALMIDLGEPFKGSFRIDSSTYQLVVMRTELTNLVNALCLQVSADAGDGGGAGTGRTEADTCTKQAHAAAEGELHASTVGASGIVDGAGSVDLGLAGSTTVHPWGSGEQGPSSAIGGTGGTLE